MREKPILFSGAMVRAILAGRKTQTRRVVAFKSKGATSTEMTEYSGFADEPPGMQRWSAHHQYPTCGIAEQDICCPYGAPGDRLWVRETFALHVGAYGENHLALYRADGDERAGPWRPSIFMPRWASRLTLEVEAVRVERLQEITNVDALAEGAMEWAAQQETPVRDATCSDARFVFQQGWDSLNAKRGFGWDANPWVWVVTFKRAEDQYGR